MPEQTSHLGLYRGGLTSVAHRREITVARSAMLQDTLAILRSNTSKKSKHHFLFIGPRGIGKTHLLFLIADEIQSDPELSATYVVARFPEESHRTRSFADFLLGLCEIICDALPDEPEWRERYEQLQTEEDDSVIVDTLVPSIRKANRDRSRTLLIMLENLNTVFSKQIKNTKDLAALRKFLMDANGCLLIATTPLHFDEITDVQQPFYDFFDIQILDNLTESQALELIERNLKWEQHEKLLESFDTLKPKLLALYRMTAGNPRLLLMLYELIAHDSVMEVRRQFALLLDRITPFYQDRMNDLPPQERALLETMACLRGQEKTPALIARHMRMSQQQVSSLLNRLSKALYLRSFPHPDDKRSRIYSIREGFFDIWLAMNLSRGARKRLPFVLDFFKIFYPKLEEREQKRTELMGQDDENAKEALDYLSEVGSENEKTSAKIGLAKLHSQKGDPDRTRTYLEEAAGLDFDPLGTWIFQHAAQNESSDYLSEIQDMIECWELHRSGDLEAFAERFISMSLSLTPETYSEAKLAFLQDNLKHLPGGSQRVQLKIIIGDTLQNLKRWDEAEALSLTTIEEAEQLPDRGILAIALNNHGWILIATGKWDQAEPFIRRALEIQEAQPTKPDKGLPAILNNLAFVLVLKKQFDEAKSLMAWAIKLDEQIYGETHSNVGHSLHNLAQLEFTVNRIDKAEQHMQKALTIMEQGLGMSHPDVARVLIGLAGIFSHTNRPDQAMQQIERAREILEGYREKTGHTHPLYEKISQAGNASSNSSPEHKKA